MFSSFRCNLTRLPESEPLLTVKTIIPNPKLFDTYDYNNHKKTKPFTMTVCSGSIFRCCLIVLTVLNYCLLTLLSLLVLTRATEEMYRDEYYPPRMRINKLDYSCVVVQKECCFVCLCCLFGLVRKNEGILFHAVFFECSLRDCSKRTSSSNATFSLQIRARTGVGSSKKISSLTF